MKKIIFLLVAAAFATSSLFAFDPAAVETPEKRDAKNFERFDRDLKKAEVDAENDPMNASAIKRYLKLVEKIDSTMMKSIANVEKKTKDTCRFDKSLMYLRELKKYDETVQRINAAYAKVGALVPKTSSPVSPSFSIEDIDARITEATNLSLDAHYVAALGIEEKAKKASDKETAIPHYLRIMDLNPEYKDVKARCDSMIKTVMMNTILVIDDNFNTIFEDPEFVSKMTAELKKEAGTYSQYFTQADLIDFQGNTDIEKYFSVEKMNEFAAAKDLGSVGAVVVLMNVDGKTTDPKEEVKKIEVARYVLPDGTAFKAAEWENTVEKVRKISKEIERAKKKGMSDSQIDLEFQAEDPQLYASYKTYSGQLDAARKEIVAVLDMVTSTRIFNLDVKDAYMITGFEKRPKTTKFKFDFSAEDSVIWYRLEKGTLEDLRTYAPEYADWYLSNNNNEGLKTEEEFIREIKVRAEKEIPELVLKEMGKIRR